MQTRCTGYLPQARELVEQRKNVYAELGNPALCARHIHPLRLPVAEILTGQGPLMFSIQSLLHTQNLHSDILECLECSLYFSNNQPVHTDFANMCLPARSYRPHCLGTERGAPDHLCSPECNHADCGVFLRGAKVAVDGVDTGEEAYEVAALVAVRVFALLHYLLQGGLQDEDGVFRHEMLDRAPCVVVVLFLRFKVCGFGFRV
jgi:hypothetical protein